LVGRILMVETKFGGAYTKFSAIVFDCIFWRGKKDVGSRPELTFFSQPVSSRGWEEARWKSATIGSPESFPRKADNGGSL